MTANYQIDSDREPRSRLIGRHVENWLNGTIAKQEAYSDRVRELYFSHHPHPADRRVRFHCTGDAIHDLRENRQIVMRRLRGDIKMEADFEEAAILALPERPRGRLLRRLAGRFGLLAVPIPGSGADGAACNLSRLAREFGEAVTAYGQLLDDGRVDSDDDPVLLAQAVDETDDLLAAASSFRAALVAALQQQDAL